MSTTCPGVIWKSALAVALPIALASSASVRADTVSNREVPTKFEIIGSDASTEETATLGGVLSESIATFEARLTSLADRRIKASIGAEACLRVGYSFTEKTIRFCETRDVIDKGLASKDVIRHESFHAMVCEVRPEWCSKEVLADPDAVAVHEALADFFAYSMAPDDCFGENFYRGRTCARGFRTSACYSLVDGAHEKGNAIVSYLIASHLALKDLRAYIASGDLSLDSLFQSLNLARTKCFEAEQPPRISLSIAGYPPSKLNKYWLKPDVPLEISFEANSAAKMKYRRLAIKLTPAAGSVFRIEETSPFSYRILSAGESGVEKLIALFLDGDEVIGSRALYLGSRGTGDDQD